MHLRSLSLRTPQLGEAWDATDSLWLSATAETEPCSGPLRPVSCDKARPEKGKMGPFILSFQKRGLFIHLRNEYTLFQAEETTENGKIFKDKAIKTKTRIKSMYF